MPRTCTICSHPDRHAIDQAIVAGVALAKIATEYHVIDESLRRHRDSHLPIRMVQAQEAEEVRQALDMLVQLKAINSASLQVLADARRAGAGELALKAIDRVHRQIELQTKLLGELDDRPQINVLVLPEWITLRTALLSALAPYAEARMAVAGVLARQGHASG